MANRPQTGGRSCEKKKVMSLTVAFRGDGDNLPQVPTAQHTLKPAQAFIAVTCKVNPRLPTERLALMKNTRNSAQVMGTVSYPTILDVKQGELVFGIRGRGGAGSGAAGGSGGMIWQGETGTAVFSAVNGMVVRGPSQEAFEDSLFLAGVAANPATFERGQGTTPSLTVQVAGSGTTYNTGRFPISFGDLLVWRMPAVTPEGRSRPEGMPAPGGGRPRDKLVAIIEPLRESHVADMLRSLGAVSARYLLKEASLSKLPLSNADPQSRGNGLSRTEHYALAQKDLMLGALFHGLTALADLGVITINAPADPLTPNGYIAKDEDLKCSLTDLVGGGARTDQTADAQKRYEEGLVWLGAKLGLVQTRKHKENCELTRKVLGRQLAGSITDDSKLKADYSEARLFQKMGPVRVTNGGALHKYNLNNPAAHLVKHQMEYARRAEQAYTISQLELQRRIWGRAMSNAPTGEPVDFAMGV